MVLSSEERKRIEYIQQRLNNFKLQLEKLEKYLAGPNADATNAKIRLEILAPLFEGALKYCEELLVLQPKNPQLEIFESVESRYYDVATNVSKLQSPVQSGNNDTLNSSMGFSRRQDLQPLPNVDVPKFDGRRENWANYKNKFLAVVDSRDDIGDAVKCSLLLQSLTGPAKAKVAQFDPSATNYSKAWQTLLEFYDHKRIIAMEHLDAILDLPKLTKASAENLTALLDVLRPNLHILEGLGARSSDEHLLVRIIERSLPPSLRSRWQDKLQSDHLPKLDDLTKFIQNAIFKQEAVDYSDPPQRNPQTKRAGDTPSRPPKRMARSPAHAFVTAATPRAAASPNIAFVCEMCRGPHRLYRCFKFIALSIQERWALVRRIRICQNCLWDHPHPCGSNRRCKECNLEHHTLLHTSQSSKDSPNSPATLNSNTNTA